MKIVLLYEANPVDTSLVLGEIFSRKKNQFVKEGKRYTYATISNPENDYHETNIEFHVKSVIDKEANKGTDVIYIVTKSHFVPLIMRVLIKDGHIDSGDFHYFEVTCNDAYGQEFNLDEIPIDKYGRYIYIGEIPSLSIYTDYLDKILS